MRRGPRGPPRLLGLLNIDKLVLGEHPRQEGIEALSWRYPVAKFRVSGGVPGNVADEAICSLLDSVRDCSVDVAINQSSRIMEMARVVLTNVEQK
jgi:hypothetical protein